MSFDKARDISHVPQHYGEHGLHELNLSVNNVTFYNEESGWAILKGQEEGSLRAVTALGPVLSPQPGELLLLFGIWTEHVSFGSQFKIHRSVRIRPHTEEGMIRYLSGGLFKGVGLKTAEKIVHHFKKDTFKVLDQNPQKLKTVPHFSKKTAAKVIRVWEEKTQETKILAFLQTHGFSPHSSKKILDMYGRDTISTVSQNPYALIRKIYGMGFLTADKIARSIGLAMDSPERVQQGILYQLQQAEDKGHCYLTEAQLLDSLAKTLELPRHVLDPKFLEESENLEEQAQICVRPPKADGEERQRRFFLADLLLAENEVSFYLQQIIGSTAAKTQESNLASSALALQARVETWLSLYGERTGNLLSEEQREAVRIASREKVFILTGGPGVGKTTTAKTIIHLFRAMGKKVFLAAPTGRAAQRLKEVSSLPAKTIHRLLEFSQENGSFHKDETNPLNCDVLILDEVSMVDIRMARSLLKAVPLTAQIVLIGDVDQLPSVGPGNFLRDLIASGSIPYIRLSQVFRQAESSSIVDFAHMINRGETPSFSNDPHCDCHFIEARDAEEIIDLLKNLLVDLLPKAGYDALRDVQILTPMNRGELGSEKINAEIQGVLNPSGLSPSNEKEIKLLRQNVSLRTGDKVIQTVNNYELSVFNGDIGYIAKTKVEGGKSLVSFNERMVQYSEEQVLDLKLAYSITIHKSQGSEFPVVIIPLLMSHYVMLQRNLIYTALTRAKKLAIFVGSLKALTVATKNHVSSVRQTSLKESLFKT
ncbi:MAG: ATP-dependent RecD-like DNA helicase [Oligoflexales bacterium]|nr:ATP-dependent RecD-like DNA helicase [Oligoflexales bacterium]